MVETAALPAVEANDDGPRAKSRSLQVPPDRGAVRPDRWPGNVLIARALLGGLAIVAVVALLHGPQGSSGTAQADDRSPCTAAGAGYVCDAVAGLSTALRRPILPLQGEILPPRTVPGAIDPAITQANIDTTICRPGYAASARPPYAITGPLKRRLMAVHHPGKAMADCELDHLIPISIGGAPLDPRDLWLQSRRGQANAGDKNILAYVLWRLVCEHRVPLATAQGAIARDWTEAYRRYATPQNVARYHFRHGAGARD